MTPPDCPLQGRVAIVTGASRGIGCAIAERLASAGAEIVAAARTVDGRADIGTVSATVERIRARGGIATPMALDVTSAESREALISNVTRKYGRIDMLVNNAGTATYQATDAMPLETATMQIETYFLAPWHLCSLVLPVMKRQGEGRILNIGSCVAFPPEPPYEDYNAARGYEALYAGLKTAVHRFSQGLAAEVFNDKIAVNVLGPVLAVYTPGVAALNLGITPDMEICEPPEDIAEAAVEMLSRPVDYTGQVEFSYQFLDRIGRPTMTLDGATVLKNRLAREANLVR